MSTPDTACVAFKGRMMTLTVLEIRDTDISAIGADVQRQVARSPGFFARMPVLLSLPEAEIDLPAVNQALREADLVVVGVLDADERAAAAAQAAGLGVLSSPARAAANGSPEPAATDDRGTAGRSGESRSSGQAAPERSDNETPTRLITKPVRSGQQIYARGGDLVVTTSVSEGAEVLADGHIHIYGALRGRALAGAAGDARARIFCRRFEPDLIAIAGCYKVADAIDEGMRGQCVQVCLTNDSHSDNLLIELQE